MDGWMDGRGGVYVSIGSNSIDAIIAIVFIVASAAVIVSKQNKYTSN